MCLDVIDKQQEPTTEWETGYKVFHRSFQKLMFPFYGMDGCWVVPRNRVIKAHRDYVEGSLIHYKGSLIQYKSGFHFFQTESDAEVYARHLDVPLSNIFEVKVRGVRVWGKQVVGGLLLTVGVADEMLVPE